MSEKPGAGAILIGIFLILFGLCVTLLGGGCAAFWILEIAGGGTFTGAGGYLLVALVTLAAGLFLLWISVKMLRGKYRNDQSAHPPEPLEP
jgi:threonine/homoserine/homoserine lactone efflux protein